MWRTLRRSEGVGFQNCFKSCYLLHFFFFLNYRFVNKYFCTHPTRSPDSFRIQNSRKCIVSHSGDVWSVGLFMVYHPEHKRTSVVRSLSLVAWHTSIGTDRNTQPSHSELPQVCRRCWGNWFSQTVHEHSMNVFRNRMYWNINRSFSWHHFPIQHVGELLFH